MSETVAWNYNGSNLLTATVTGAVNGDIYMLGVDCQGTRDVEAVSGGSVVLTNSNVSGGSYPPDGTFEAFLEKVGAGSTTGSPGIVVDPTDNRAANIFKLGKADTVGEPFPATWSYDGTTITIDFTASSGITYGLCWFSDTGAAFGEVTGGPYTNGSNQTLSIVPEFSAGEGVLAVLTDEAFAISQYSNKIFLGGVPDSGFSGNPSSAPGPEPAIEGIVFALADGPFDTVTAWTRVD